MLTLSLLLGAGIVLGAQLGVLAPPAGLHVSAMVVAGVALMMAACWIFEALPFAATSLFPVVAFPVLGVASAKEVASAYANSTILLFMGGFFLAKGLERWQVPHRLAEVVSKQAGGSALRLHYGLMGTTALLSMWLSNTATTLIMVTVADAALRKAASISTNGRDELQRFRVALLLGIAYAANVGGIATPVGTAPNLILLSLRKELEPAAATIPFFTWMVLALPIVVLMVPLMGFLLARVLSPFSSALELGAPTDKPEAPMSRGAKRALLIFAITVILWVTRSDVDLGVMLIPGWSGMLGLQKVVDDSTVAMFGASLMFLFPADQITGSSAATRPRAFVLELPARWLRAPRVLDWEVANQIPWYLLLLFGGGIALANAFSSSGLSTWIGQQLVVFSGAPAWVVVLVLCLGVSLLTEVTSNTASTTLLLPVLFAAAPALGLPPLLLMWPATLAASAAFILPVSTPPNAIVAGAGEISPLQMARVGVWLNLLAVLFIAGFSMVWLVPQMGLTW